VAATATTLAVLQANAGPLDDPHVADTGFSGPTTGDLTAVYWNPAGLGLLQGPQLMLSGSLHTTSVSVDPQAGSTARGSGTTHPFRSPFVPGSFFAIGAGIGHRFGIAVALYSPFSTRLDMPSGDDASTRYHLVSMRLDHMALTPGIAIHASDSIQLGVASGFLFPSAHMVFDEAVVVGQGADATASSARYDVATQGVIAPSVFLSLGADYRRGRFALGIAYNSAPLSNGGTMNLPLDRVRIDVPSDPACNDEQHSDCLFGQMSYRLPSIYSLGSSWQASQHWSVNGMVRWLRYGSHDKVTILISGPGSQKVLGQVAPDHVVLYRGFVDSLDLRGRVVFDNRHFRASGTFRVETSAVPASHVSAGAIDGTKLEPAVAAEMHLWRQIRIGASYAFRWMLPVDTGASVFDPTAAAACDAARGDLATPACRARMDGQARPSAAGTYHMWQQTLTVYTTVGL
jgi:long-subunit fatty acid transport protein